MSLDLKARTPTIALEEAAQDLAAKLPALLVEARRVASTVAQGTHGRRRPGPGETFWQYRSFEQGDSATLIDWRRSAGCRAIFSCASANGRPRTRSGFGSICRHRCISARISSAASKAERAIVLALALASLLSDAGERVGIPGLMQAKAGHNTASLMVETLARSLAGPVPKSLPDAKNRLGRHSELAIFGDFLETPEQACRRLSAPLPAKACAATSFKFSTPPRKACLTRGGSSSSTRRRMRASWPSGPNPCAKATRRSSPRIRRPLPSTPAGLGWTPFLHHTNRPAVEALLPLHMHLSGLEKAYRAKGTLKGELAGEGDAS